MANGDSKQSTTWNVVVSASVLGLMGTFLLIMATNIDNAEFKVDTLALNVAKQDSEIISMQKQILELHEDVRDRTRLRYTAEDAKRDLKFIEFRFMRNEQNIQQCMDFIEKHKAGGNVFIDDGIFWGGSGNDADLSTR